VKSYQLLLLSKAGLELSDLKRQLMFFSGLASQFLFQLIHRFFQFIYSGLVAQLSLGVWRALMCFRSGNVGPPRGLVTVGTFCLTRWQQICTFHGTCKNSSANWRHFDFRARVMHGRMVGIFVFQHRCLRELADFRKAHTKSNSVSLFLEFVHKNVENVIKTISMVSYSFKKPGSNKKPKSSFF
jgi:hypothetical protein